MIKLRTLIIVWLVIIALLIFWVRADGKSFDQKVADKLTGGSVSTKSMSLWELQQYRDVNLLRKAPLCYAPWKAYIAVSEYVTIETRNNRYYLVIGTNLKKLLSEDARFNKAFAKAFKATGTKKQQIRKIWNGAVTRSTLPMSRPQGKSLPHDRAIVQVSLPPFTSCARSSIFLSDM